MQRIEECPRTLLVNKTISYAILGNDDIDETVQAVLSAFTLGEPKCKALGITKDEGLVYSNSYCRKAAAEGFSIVARDRETGKIAGFQINADFISDPPAGIEGISPPDRGHNGVTGKKIQGQKPRTARRASLSAAHRRDSPVFGE